MIFDRFFHRKRDEAAELRDALIVAETQVLLLRDIVDHPPSIRRQREVRKDAGAYLAAKAETTQRLMRMQGRGG
jgi:hypothetical protein